MPERLSSEEARTIPLSKNPIRRLGQLAEYGSAFNLIKVGGSPLPSFLTRGDLVRVAEASEQAASELDIFEATSKRHELPESEIE